MSAAGTLRAQNNLIVTGDLWTYWDLGLDADPSWTLPEFDDSNWATGPSPLGFGETYITTTIQTGITTAYFRRRFDLADFPAGSITLRVRRDDGVIVYINGWEVFRDNMPSGAVDYTTLAAGPAMEPLPYLQATIDPTFFLTGENVIVAEVHQADVFSSDMVFDIQLIDPNSAPTVRISITAPTDNSFVRAGRDLNISAVGTPVPEITRVDFYRDQTLLGSDSQSPYGIVWPQVPEGSYLLRAVALTTAGGSVTSAPVRLTATFNNILPSVTITNPPNNSVMAAGDIILEASASDPDGTVTLVEFFADGIKVGEDRVEPYSVVWAATDGDHLVSARATDDTGSSVNSPNVFVRVGGGSIGVLRGPYLQSGTPTSVIVKWRTESALDSLVRYGSAPNNLNLSAQVGGLTIDHEVPLTGLSPDTKYYYSIGSSAARQAGGPDYFFVTSPPGPKPTRVWVIGDSGTASEQARQVWLSYSNYTRGRYTDAWLMLGDNAYGSGTDFEYQRGMFDMYPDILRQTVVWPTIGNHDASPAYFDIFSLPRNGEAGGVASGVENYYSFDYGSIHFICLGGYYSGSRLSNGLMCTWLKADLDANTNKWLIAYWHQPPYTKGSHNSDFEYDLVEMRENAVPILESYGVDLVLNGHSHCYERSYLMRGHYGYSSSLEPEMLLNTGSGRIDETGPYIKQTEGATAHHGTVYVVAGSSGWATYGSLDHPIMYTSWLRMGSLVLDIDGDTLNGTFLRDNGAIDDYFTIAKEGTVVRIVDMSFDQGTAILFWTSTPGRRYRVEFTANLDAGWTHTSDPLLADDTITGVGHFVGSAPKGFYRVLQID